MITLTVLQLLNAAGTLQDLVTQPHKGAVAFTFRRMVNTLHPDFSAASVAKDAMFNDDNSVPHGKGRALKPESVAAFVTDPLFSQIVEVNVVPLTPADLENATISPAQLDALGPLVSD
ncbi:MAG: hypothetical protein ABSG41_15550 [Bryobacteraceae bacterium]|jgi:hypothetical protein